MLDAKLKQIAETVGALSPDGSRITNAEAVARAIVERAAKGESWAIEEVFDRIDGRIQLTPQEEAAELQNAADADPGDVLLQVQYMHDTTYTAGREEEIERMVLQPHAALDFLEKCYFDNAIPLPGEKPFTRPSFEEWKSQLESSADETQTTPQENPNE